MDDYSQVFMLSVGLTAILLISFGLLEVATTAELGGDW